VPYHFQNALSLIKAEPLRILLINPNSTASMTEQADRSARRTALAGTIIEAINPADTPRSDFFLGNQACD